MRFLRHIAAALAVWILNRFEGASFSTSRSYIPHAVQSARFEVSASARMEIVRKSQYFEENNAIVNRMADLFECYTVGCGLQMNPASSSPEWNRLAKAWIEDWSNYCDISSLQSFGVLQGLIARKWFVDGEVFIVFANGESNRPRLQLIESHLVATPPHLKDQEGITVIDGVQIDPRGRPTGYYIADEDARGKKTWGTAKPASMVIHLFEPTRPGQYRGLPFVYPVINTLHDLDDLLVMEMKKAKDAADTTNVIKTKTGELPNNADLRREQYTQGRTISTGATVNETKEKHYRDALGGRTLLLYKDDEAEQFKAESPSAATQWFWRELKEQACAGVGIPYIMCFPDSMQGTVYRGALDMAAQFFKCRSQVIIDAVRQIYQRHVMRWAVQNVPELRNGRPADWHKVTIRPPRAVNVDVGRNMTAELAALAAGTTNYDLLLSPQGIDWRDHFDALAEQRQYAKDKGLNLEPEKPNEQPPNGGGTAYNRLNGFQIPIRKAA